MDGYLFSSSYKNLSKVLELNDEDDSLIKTEISKLYSEDNNQDFDFEIARLIYNQMPKKYLSKATTNKRKLFETLKDYYYHVFIWDKNEWNFIESILISQIRSGKINNPYLLDKAFNMLFCDVFARDKKDFEYFKAHSNILLKIIDFLLRDYPDMKSHIKNYLIENIINMFNSNVLHFDAIKKYFDKLFDYILTYPSFELKNLSNGTLFISYLIVHDKSLGKFFDDEFGIEGSEFLFLYPFYKNTKLVFGLLTVGFDNGEGISFWDIDFDKNYVLTRNAICDDLFLDVNQNNELAKSFEDYANSNFRNFDLYLKNISKTTNDDFIFTKCFNSDGEWLFIDCDKKEDKKINKQEFCEDFINILSNFNISKMYVNEFKEAMDDKNELLYMINKHILINNENNPINNVDLLLKEFEIKTILLSKEEYWDEIKLDLINKTGSNLSDMYRHFSENHHTSSI